MQGVHDLLLRLAEQSAAIGEAQRALHKLVALGLVEDAATGAPTGGRSASLRIRAPESLLP